MKRITLLSVFGALALMGVPHLALAQEEEEEGPGIRYVVVTSFEVPRGERSKVFPHIRDRILPGMQLHPNVVTFRVLIHSWGSSASQVVFVHEYEDWSGIEAPCGQPCRDYFAEHPFPEEGTPEREEALERRDAFLKYWSRHKDEIYETPMGLAKVEGELMGPVGPPEESEESDG